VDINGFKAPFIVDHFSNNAQTSRVNYESSISIKAFPIRFSRKPNSPKELERFEFIRD
jgi:hypothetical protein